MGRERDGERDIRMKERVKTELSAICKRNERNRKRERERKGEREGGSMRARGCQAYITEKGKGPLGEEVGGGEERETPGKKTWGGKEKHQKEMEGQIKKERRKGGGTKRKRRGGFKVPQYRPRHQGLSFALLKKCACVCTVS